MLRSELMERMSADEFFEWMILDQIEPFGDKRGDIQAGMIQATMANIHRDHKTHPEPYGLDVFMPQFEERKPPPKQVQTPQEQFEIMLAIQSAHNAKFQND